MAEKREDDLEQTGTGSVGTDKSGNTYSAPKITPVSPTPYQSTKQQPGLADTAAGEGNVRGAHTAEQNQNMINTMTGNGAANTYNYAGSGASAYPWDYSAQAAAAMGNGVGAGVIAAIGSMRGITSATTKGYSQYLNDDTQQAMNNYAANGGFRYSDPYGYQDMIASLNPDISSRVSDYANSSYTDYTSSPEYRDLTDRYAAAGQLAMENTLGTQAQMTGGLGSSAATAAAQQAYNQYMANMESAAQAAYQNKLSQQAAGISALQGYQNTLAGLDDTLYGREYQQNRDITDTYLSTMDLLMGRRYQDNALEQNDNQYAGNLGYQYWNAAEGYGIDKTNQAIEEWEFPQQMANNIDTSLISANASMSNAATSAGASMYGADLDYAAAMAKGSGSSGSSDLIARGNSYLNALNKTGDSTYKDAYNALMGIGTSKGNADAKATAAKQTSTGTLADRKKKNIS